MNQRFSSTATSLYIKSDLLYELAGRVQCAAECGLSEVTMVATGHLG